MNEFYIRNVLEAALLAAGKPLQLAEMSQLFDDASRPKAEDIRAALDTLANEYSNRGVEVKETAAGFRIQVRREFSGEVSRLWPERPVKYSRALLETLALIAYRQPITRAEIEAVRGVAVNPNIIKTVIERNWVRVVGHRDVPGRPELLGTTREFLDYFGLRSLDELPPLAEIKTLGEYNPQLEFPGGGVPALEGPAGEGPSGDGAAGAAVGIAGVAVAGLLTSEAGMAEGDTSDAAALSDAVASGADASGSDGSGIAASDAVAAGANASGSDDSGIAASDAVAAGANVSGSDDSGVAPYDAVASGADASDSEGSNIARSDAVASGADAAGVNDSEAASDSVAPNYRDRDAAASHTVASGAAVADTLASATAASGMHRSDEDGDHAHQAVPSAVDAVGIADDAIMEGPAASEASAPAAVSATTDDVAAERATAQHNTGHDTDIEAERTLAAGESFDARAAAETDDAEGSANPDSSESFDILDDSAEEDADEDELSADGHGSRELVAGPRDLDD
jgi:segregation and condensation protein B